MKNNGNIKVGDIVWMVDQELNAFVRLKVDRITRKGNHQFNQGKGVGLITVTFKEDMADLTYIENGAWGIKGTKGFYPLDLLYDHVPVPRASTDYHGKPYTIWD